MVKPNAPSWLPSTSPLAWSTNSPDVSVSGPSFSRSQPEVSPSEMKQMSWLSGFWATCRPRRSASARTSDFGESPSGNSECASCSWVSTPST